MRTLVPFLFAALTVSGCYFDFDFDSEAEPWGYDSIESDLQVSGASLSGELGSVRGSGSTRVASAYGGSDYAYIDLRTNVSRGVLMNGLSIEGELSRLEPGEYHYDTSWNEVGGMHFSVVGCSGPQDGQWEYDTSADEVHVEVSTGETEATVDIYFEASFSDGSTSTGSFTMVN